METSPRRRCFRAPLLPRALLGPCLAAAAGCSSGPALSQDPTVVVRTPEGEELGVSTEYGVVFLGRGSQSGPVDITAWFADGPSWESGVVEALGGGLYTTQAEIRLPAVPLSFDTPAEGTNVLVCGRRDGRPWQSSARVSRDARVEGLLLRPEGPLASIGDDQLGAGVYVEDEDEGLRLVGLVSGRLRLQTDGGTREYVTVIGAEELWRVVVRDKDVAQPPRWVYREDIL